jgi:hypothetical protein
MATQWTKARNISFGVWQASKFSFDFRDLSDKQSQPRCVIDLEAEVVAVVIQRRTSIVCNPLMIAAEFAGRALSSWLPADWFGVSTICVALRFDVLTYQVMPANG